MKALRHIPGLHILYYTSGSSQCCRAELEKPHNELQCNNSEANLFSQTLTRYSITVLRTSRPDNTTTPNWVIIVAKLFGNVSG